MFKKLFDAIRQVQESQATMSKRIDECGGLLETNQTQMVNNLIHTNDELKAMLESARADADGAQAKLDHMTAVAYNQPTSQHERRISRSEANHLYGDGIANHCEETLTAYVVQCHLGETVVNYVVPKVIRQIDDKGNMVLANTFHEFPELIEGLNLYAAEEAGMKLDFLFVEYWTDDSGEELFVQPKTPQEANKVLLRMLQAPQSTVSTDKSDTVSDNREEIPVILTELMEGCGAHQINRDACWLIDLNYSGVKFDGRIDTKYKLEDYYILRAQWLKRLRDSCMKRWETYFLPDYNPTAPSAE